MHHLQKVAYAILTLANAHIAALAIRHNDHLEGVFVLCCAFAYLLVLTSHRAR